MNQVVLDIIGDNMEYIVNTGKYGSTSAIYPTTVGYYVGKFLLDSVTLKGCNTTDGQVFEVALLSSLGPVPNLHKI